MLKDEFCTREGSRCVKLRGGISVAARPRFQRKPAAPWFPRSLWLLVRLFWRCLVCCMNDVEAAVGECRLKIDSQMIKMKPLDKFVFYFFSNLGKRNFIL